MAPRRYLVIANQTLADRLAELGFGQRLEAGPSSFYMLVPNTDHGDPATRIARSAPIGAPVADATADHLHTEHAQHRLGQLLNDLHNLGADADGDIGEADPIAAVDNLLATREFDEIILSTLPQHVSKWLRMDLPHRLHRHTGLPVTTITTKRVV
jgi:hypothetical protein